MDALQVAVQRAKFARQTPRIVHGPTKFNANELSPDSFLIPAKREYAFRLPPDPPPEIKQPERKPPQISEIIDLVCWTYKVNKTDLLSDRRTRDIILPRHIACALAVSMTPHSLPTIGKHFRGRDHTTILHAKQKIARLREESHELDNTIAALERQLGGAEAPEIRERASKWSNEDLNRCLVVLVTTTFKTYSQIAAQLSKQFDLEITEDACRGRAMWLKLKCCRPKKTNMAAAA